MKLKRNMCRFDRLVRLLIGAACIYIGFVETGIINQALVNALVGIFGVMNLIAAAVAFCPVYHAAGISTLRKGPE